MVTVLLLALMAFGAAGAASNPPITAQQIAERSIAARGGIEKLKAVRSLLYRGAPRPGGRPGRQLLRARPFFFTIGSEGNDGSPWEAYDSFGLVARVTNEPAAALRHTAYFDDPLVMSLEPGWTLELIGSERFDDRDTWRLRVVYPDGWTNELFVDKQSGLLIGRRFTAPFHAFGEAVTTETHIGDYRRVAGVLFPARFAEYDPGTGRLLGGDQPWQSIEANVPAAAELFHPPAPPDTPIARLVNEIFAARFVTADALGWYHDFLADPPTSSLDVEGAIESVAYHCLKSGAVPTGTALLEENLVTHPASARARFGLGRAYRAVGRETDALREFREALRMDPTLEQAKQAIASRRLPY